MIHAQQACKATQHVVVSHKDAPDNLLEFETSETPLSEPGKGLRLCARESYENGGWRAEKGRIGV